MQELTTVTQEIGKQESALLRMFATFTEEEKIEAIASLHNIVARKHNPKKVKRLVTRTQVDEARQRILLAIGLLTMLTALAVAGFAEAPMLRMTITTIGMVGATLFTLNYRYLADTPEDK